MARLMVIAMLLTAPGMISTVLPGMSWSSSNRRVVFLLIVLVNVLMAPIVLKVPSGREARIVIDGTVLAVVCGSLDGSVKGIVFSSELTYDDRDIDKAPKEREHWDRFKRYIELSWFQ